MRTRWKVAIGAGAGVGIGVGVGVGVGVGAGMAAWQAWKTFRRAKKNFGGQVALITGGSRGLGLQLARDLGEQGCRVAICARDAEELKRAQLDLEGRGVEVLAQVCDVTRRDQVADFVQSTLARFGKLDIVVANAGVIQVGPLESLDAADFETAMNVMFWGVFHTIWSALPHMRERGSGNIVTITSIGGKVSIPHLLPYSCAKFAAVALSEGLRTECAPMGIRVLTVVPGLMRTGSHQHAEFKGRQHEEFAWFGLGASLPGLSMSFERASGQILDAIRGGRSHKILTAAAQAAVRVHGAFPELSGAVAELVNRYALPGSEKGSHDRVTGFEAERKLNSRLHRVMTYFGRRAGSQLNES